jgi:N-acetylmuramic acid 6-phosphate etherase
MTDNNHSNAAMKIADKITEQPSRYAHLDKMSVAEILYAINEEDHLVAEAVRKAMPQILNLVEKAEVKMKNGGRIFYVGAGTSGRLGVLDASELPPTFGVSADLVIGIIAGGDAALRTAVEKAEDITEKGWEDLLVHHPTQHDVVIGIAASGTTPYVIGAVTKARENGLMTGCITSNPHSPLAQVSECPIETIVGPEFLTGSSRMKSGTAQKMVLNMISTCLMIRMGRVQGNQMVNMQLTNEKLIERGVRMIRASIAISEKEARDLLLKYGSVQKVLESFPT